MTQLTDQERLALLDGDTEFFPGVVEMMENGYNVSPFVHGEVKQLRIPESRFADGPRCRVVGKSTWVLVAMARGATWYTNREERVGLQVSAPVRYHTL